MIWQVCPLCKGQGHVAKPKYVPGDVFEFVSTATSHVCWICNGQGKILSPIDWMSYEIDKEEK